MKTKKLITLEFVPYFFKLKQTHKLDEYALLVYGFISLYHKFFQESDFYFTDEQISQILNLEIDKVKISIQVLLQKSLIKRIKLFEKDEILRKIILINQNNQKLDEYISTGLSQDGACKVRAQIEEFKKKLRSK